MPMLTSIHMGRSRRPLKTVTRSPAHPNHVQDAKLQRLATRAAMLRTLQTSLAFKVRLHAWRCSCRWSLVVGCAAFPYPCLSALDG